MTDTTDPAPSSTLLALAAAYLRDDLRPHLEGRHQFMTLIAANAIDIVARELRLSPAAETREVERLALLLGRTGDRQTLNEALCDALAEGCLDETSPGVLDHLFASTMARLEIDQPRYGAYRRERSETSSQP